MKTKQSREKDLEAILIMCVGLLVVYFATKQQHRVLITLTIVLGLIGTFSTFLISKIVWLWMQIGEKMGWVMSKVILGLVFFVFLLPMALLSRALSKEKSSLQLKKPEGDTYYFTRNHKYEPKDLKNVW